MSGAHGGGGGGASGVSSTATCAQWLALGGGGGGGGAGFINFQSDLVDNYAEAGGQGGSGCPIDGGPGCGATDARRELAITDGELGRAGGSPPSPWGGRYRGADARAMQGGAGGSGQPGGGGGGGGGGYYGGGGGGGGGVLTGGGGGGGGASFAITGASGTPSFGFGDGAPDAFRLVPAAAGSVTITAVPKAVPPLKMSVSATPTPWGRPPSLSARLPADATGIVGFYDDINGGCDFSGRPGARCVEVGLAQIMDGVATIPAPAPPLDVGSHELHASYTGDRRYKANDSAAMTVEVDKGDPALDLRISGTVLTPGRAMKSMVVLLAPDATGSVSFSLLSPGDTPATELGSAAIVKGAATLRDLAAATGRLRAGANRIRASYAGNDRYRPGTSNVVTVSLAGGG